MNKVLGQQYAAFLLIFILLLSGLFAYFSLQEGHDWGGDFALYFRQAQSLLDGTSEELLEFNRYAMENSTQQLGANPQIGPHLYPWGLPILLSPVIAIWGYALTPIKVYIILFFLLSLWVCYRLFLPRIGPAYSLWLVALLGFSPYMVTFNGSINSDIPFLFFALLSLLFIEKSLGYRPYFVNATTTHLLTGILICFSFMVRTNGIVLIGVLGLGQLIKWYKPLMENPGPTLKKEWKELFPYVGFVGFYLLMKAFLPSGSGSHLAFLQRLTPGKLAYNIMYYIELPAEFYEGVLFPSLIYGFTIPFFLLGIARRWRNMPDALYLIYSAVTLLVFIIWPPIQGLRFIFSVLPFYLYFVFTGLSVARKALAPALNWGSKIPWVPVFGLLVVGLFIFRNVATVYRVNQGYPNRELAEGPYTPQSQEVFRVLKERTRPDDTIIFFKPRVLSLITGQQSIRVTEESEIFEGKGNYLVYHKEVDFAQIPFDKFLELKEQIPPIFENEQFVVLDLRKLQRASADTVRE